MAGIGRTPIRTRAGERRHAVTLSSAAGSVDSMGGQPEGDYATFGTDRAKIQEIPFIVSGSEHGMLADISLPYRADLIEEFLILKKRVRVASEAQAYDVLEIENPGQMNIELILHCAPALVVGT